MNRGIEKKRFTSEATRFYHGCHLFHYIRAYILPHQRLNLDLTPKAVLAVVVVAAYHLETAYVDKCPRYLGTLTRQKINRIILVWDRELMPRRADIRNRKTDWVIRGYFDEMGLDRVV
jgi:hypothetical protein